MCGRHVVAIAYDHGATERTEDALLRQTEGATRGAELGAAVVFGALGTTDYDALSVEEVAGRIDGLSDDQFEQVRGFEKGNKDRRALVGQIDRKMRASDS